MRNRAVCERNRLERLIRQVKTINRMRRDPQISAGEYLQAEMDLHSSWDWQHATRVTRALVNHYLVKGVVPKRENRTRHGVTAHDFPTQ